MDQVVGAAYALLADFDGNSALAVLVFVHFCGLALALPGVVIGNLMGVRMLLFAGGPVSQRAVGLAYWLVFGGLCLLLMSGTALFVIRHDPLELSPQLGMKLSLAAVLCLNALSLQQHLLPLARFGLRPLAVTLPIGHLLRVVAIGTVSVVAWIAIAAVSMPWVGARPLGELIAAIAAGWGVLFIATAATALGLRAFNRVPNRRDGGFEAAHGIPAGEDFSQRNTDTLDLGARGSDQRGVWPREGAHDCSHDWPPFTAAEATAPDPHLLRAGDVVPLGERLARLTGMPPVNDNPREPAGERLQFRHHTQRRDQTSPASLGRHHERGDDAMSRGHAAAARAEPGRHFNGGGAGTSADDKDAAAEETYAWRDVRRACRRAVWAVAAISFVTNMLMLTGPLFMLQVYDRVLTSKSLPTLTVLFALAVALFAFMGVLEALRNRLLVRVGLRVDRLLSRQIFSGSILPQDKDARAQSVQLMRDVRHIRQFVGGAGAAALFDMPWAPFYFGLLFLFHPLLGAVAVAGALLLVVLALVNEWFSREPVGEAARYGAEGERIAEMGRRNDEILRAMGMGSNLRDRWLEAHAREALSQTRGADISGGFSVTIKSVRLILQSGILAAGAYLVLQGQVTAGIMIASSIMLSRALAPIETAVGGWRGFIAAREGAWRLSRVFADAPAMPQRLRLSKPQGRVVLEGVYAAPPGVADPVLKGLSFGLEPGDAVGVLGPSGSGKSALARVLVGVWTPVRGDVRLDGAALSHWPAEQLGANVGYVPQAAELLDGTVAENISRFERKAAPEEIIAAARMANVHDMIQQLPDGYNTRVAAGGALLSGGQRQRIALARALYRQPALLVLDEPNANLDAAGERALNAAITTAREAGSAVVVLTNRRKALENVNLLLVLKDGRQVGFGPKEEVLAALSAGAASARAGPGNAPGESGGMAGTGSSASPHNGHRQDSGRFADVSR